MISTLQREAEVAGKTLLDLAFFGVIDAPVEDEPEENPAPVVDERDLMYLDEFMSYVEDYRDYLAEVA